MTPELCVKVVAALRLVKDGYLVKRAAVGAQRNGGFIAIHYKGEMLENAETSCKPR